ncbi:MAG TPA: flagellar biosynthetic protein FliO [Kribbella sp.]|nr:fliO [Cryobacterium sp.]
MDTAVVALRVVVSLAVVLGLLWVLQRRLNKGARTSRAGDLVTVIGRRGIGQKASVVIVDVDGTRFVLGVTEQSINVLHSELREESMPALAGPRRAAAFAQTLRNSADSTDAGRVQPPLEFRPRHRNTGRLGGSILSSATWQQTVAALRQN